MGRNALQLSISHQPPRARLSHQPPHDPTTPRGTLAGEVAPTLPVCEDGEGPVSLNQVPHHADLRRAKEPQRQRLPGDQDHHDLRQHRDHWAAVVIVQRPAVELLHVSAQVLRRAQVRGQERARGDVWGCRAEPWCGSVSPHLMGPSGGFPVLCEDLAHMNANIFFFSPKYFILTKITNLLVQTPQGRY